MHEKADFSDLERGMVVGEEGLKLQKLLICCDFPTQASLGFMENGLKKRNHPLSSSFLGGKCLVVPLLSANNIKVRLQFNKAHHAWTSEDQKNVFQHLDGKIRIWHKQRENVDPFGLVSAVQAASGVMVWVTCFWHSLGPTY